MLNQLLQTALCVLILALSARQYQKRPHRV
jgi:hypothetical protein